MEFVAENLTAVNERRKNCYELVKLRISRLKQKEEIIKCEKFGTEVNFFIFFNFFNIFFLDI